METYHTKIAKLSGTKYSEVYKNASRVYKAIKSKSKRKPYLRSGFFRGEKIFLDIFWIHLRQKQRGERLRRLKYYSCSLDMLQNSKCKPLVKNNPENSSEHLYRFKGITKNREIFYVQIKEKISTKQKHFMSCFPEK